MTVKKLYVNKAVIVGIAVVIAIAIASGIYAVSTPQNDSLSGDIGMKDEVEATIEEPKEEQIASEEESEMGMKDEADATIEPPEEVPSVIKENVEEKTGMIEEELP